jgi:hypothetical protein
MVASFRLSSRRRRRRKSCRRCRNRSNSFLAKSEKIKRTCYLLEMCLKEPLIFFFFWGGGGKIWKKWRENSFWTCVCIKGIFSQNLFLVVLTSAQKLVLLLEITQKAPVWHSGHRIHLQNRSWVRIPPGYRALTFIWNLIGTAIVIVFEQVPTWFNGIAVER